MNRFNRIFDYICFAICIILWLLFHFKVLYPSEDFIPLIFILLADIYITKNKGEIK